MWPSSTVLRCATLAKVAPVVLLIAIIGCRGESSPRPTVDLEPVASTPVPFSANHGVALVDNDMVCVTNSYEVRVRCLRRNGSVAGVFGGMGEGPGEFPFTPKLVRGPDGTLGTISGNRFTVFQPDGVMLSETTLPVGDLQVQSPFGTSIMGQHFGGGAEVTPIEIDVATGDALWERRGLATGVRTECGSVSLGIPSPGGGWTFPACQRELVFFDGRDDPTPTIVRAPTYAEELPNDRDVAEIEFRNSRSAFRLDLAAFRETPKRNHLRVASLAYDDRGRLWVATERDRARYSYLDIYDGVEYVGTVRIRDRLLGYDLYGPVLVALVERQPDSDGIARRWADWYDIRTTSAFPARASPRG